MPETRASTAATSQRTQLNNDYRHKSASPEVDRRALSPKPPAVAAIARVSEAPSSRRTASPQPQSPPPPPPSAKKEKEKEKEKEVADEKESVPAPSDDGPIINEETFEQILELDDEDDHSFSWGMVAAFFSQADLTFDEMDAAYKSKDLDTLSKKGHFLKGSSAALGVQKVQDSCERIQNYGKLRDEEAGISLTSDVALKKIGALLGVVKRDFKDAKEHLRKRYIEFGVDVDEPVALE